MQGWQTSYLGLRDLPRELSEFELQAFFSFGRSELELIARRRLEAINLRGVFRFPVERYAGQLLPSQTAAKTSASG